MDCRGQLDEANEFILNDKRIHRYEIELLPAIMDLHMATTGSLECPTDYAEEVRAKCQWRLDHWHDPSFPFDRIVKQLLEVALADYRNQVEAQDRLAKQFADDKARGRS